jgi:hypothetical protein
MGGFLHPRRGEIGVTCSPMALAALALGSTHRSYLLEARQMQALSFAVHIPLVCFGIAFPAMVLFVEWRYLRTGDELYRTLAKRWSKDGGVVRGRRDHRHHPQLRDGAALAGAHGHLRFGVWAGLRGRGLRSSSRRSSSGSTCTGGGAALGFVASRPDEIANDGAGGSPAGQDPAQPN